MPFFLVAGLLFVLTNPSLALARWLLYGYVVSRLLHFVAYFQHPDSRHSRNVLDRGVADRHFHDLLDVVRRVGLVTAR